MKKITAFLGVVAFAAIIFAGASNALATADPLYFQVSIAGKGFLVDDFNKAETSVSYKSAGYLMWTGDEYFLVLRCPHEGGGGWYSDFGVVDAADSGKAIYIADLYVNICIPNGLAVMQLTARIAYKLKDGVVSSAMLSSLAAQVPSGYITDNEGVTLDGALIGGAQVKGKLIAFDKLPADVQDIFNNYGR